MNTPFTINNYFNAHKDIFEKLNVDEIDHAIQIIQKTFESNKKIITCGMVVVLQQSHITLLIGIRGLIWLQVRSSEEFPCATTLD